MQREEFDKLLWALPVSERVAMLILSVAERDPNAFRTSVALLNVLMVMSDGLGVENRAKFVAQLRAAADNFEASMRPLHDEQRLLH
jgi:hypothetical protein